MSKACVLASVNTVLKACTFTTWVFTSSCVAVSLTNTALASSNTLRAVSTAVLSASWAVFNFSSNDSTLAFKISFFTSALAVSFVDSDAAFSATADATDSLVFSTVVLATVLGVTSDFSLDNVLSVVVLLDTSSAACATTPAPKKILAPTTTDAAPTLNFLIEYDSTFVPCLVSFK